MQYGDLIRQAWRTTWSNRWLWLLGLFAGGSAGISAQQPVQWRTSPGEWPTIGPALEREAAAAAVWLSANLTLVVALIAVGAALLVALLALSLIAQGGMARATTDLAEGRTSSLGQAWRTGLRLVWRYAGLWGLLAGVAAGLALVVAGCIALAISASAVSDTTATTVRWVAAAVPLLVLAVGILLLVGDLLSVRRGRVILMVIAIVTVAPTMFALMVLAIAVSVTVAFAQRAIAVDDVGPIEALQSSWELLRGHLGESALALLIAMGLGLVGGAVAAVLAGAAVAVLAVVGVGLWSAGGFATPVLAYAAIALIAGLAVILMIAGAVNTFFWNYWTIAYLRLRGRATAA